MHRQMVFKFRLHLELLLELGEMFQMRSLSALAVAKSAFPMACTVKAQHLASLTTKAFFRKCQIRKSGSARVYAHAMRCAGGSPRAIFLPCTPAAPRRRNPSKSWTPALS